MPSYWQRRQRWHWPPSPSVEDEADSLAHEISTGAIQHTKPDDEAQSRGTVDQYPIILDINQSKSAGSGSSDPNQPPHFDTSSIASQSSEDSHGPPTPRNVRFISDVKAKSGPQRLSTKGKEIGREDREAKLSAEKQEERPRGRPNIAKIDTDLGGDLQGMISGQRRAPSPYAFTKSEPVRESKSDGRNRFSGELFLSPDNATPKRRVPTVEAKRSSSTKPRERHDEHNSSTESEHHRDRQRHRYRHHSRRRSARESHAGRDSSLEREHREAREHHHRKHRDHSRQRASSESQETDRRGEQNPSHHQRHRHSDRDGTKTDSPHHSSAEDTKAKSKSQGHLDVSDEIRHRRQSQSQLQRPALDPSSSHYSFDGSEVVEKNDSGQRHRKDQPAESNLQGRRVQPMEAPSVNPNAMEDVFESALHRNKRKTNPSPHPSPLASPRESPNSTAPNTPPHTPRPTDRPFPDATVQNNPSQGQAGPPKPKVPSRTSSMDVPLYPVNAPPKFVRPNPLLSKPSRSPSEVHYVPKLDEKINNARPKYTSPLPSPVDHPPLQRAGSYAFPLGRGPQSTQRSFSYSTNDTQRPSPDNAHRTSVYRMSDLPFMPGGASSPTTPRMSRSSAPSSQEKVPQLLPQSPVTIDLPECPRSTPTIGYHDWYTIGGLSHVDICPTCMKSIGNSRFRDLFIPSLPKRRDERVSCMLSDPWVRVAWIQTIKQHRSNLDLLHQVLQRPSKTFSCPGKKVEARKWFRLVNPETDEPVHGFSVCSACVRRLEIVFPQLQGIFKRTNNLLQERKCDLECNSHRFDKYVEMLDSAARECDMKHASTPNIAALISHADRMAQLRECNRDNMVLATGWHFHPDIPELTICEECYDTVVWPIRERPIARDVTRTLSLVPGHRPDRGISCQLYSKKMRTKFEEAVWHHDFHGLKELAMRRFTVERRLQERHALLMEDVKKGHNRQAELEKNVSLWKQIE